MLKSRRDCRQLDFWAPIPQQVQLKSLSNPHQYKTVQSLQIDLPTRPVTVLRLAILCDLDIDLDQRVLVCSRDGRPSNSKITKRLEPTRSIGVHVPAFIGKASCEKN